MAQSQEIQVPFCKPHMLRRRLLVFALLVVGVSAQLADQVGAASEPCTHAIKAGDTLSALAGMYKMDLSELQAMNPNVDASNLQLGQNISVPCGGPVLCLYSIENGDTYASLAIKYDISLEDLEALNVGVHAQQLRVGEEIYVPCGGPSECIYSIESGDTLASIAAEYDIDVQDIVDLNAGVDPKSLSVGQVLKMPCNITAAAGEDTAEGCKFTVKAGMTLDCIARAYGVSADELQALNGNLDATKMQIDQAIAVPCTQPLYCTYFLREGDTLAAILTAIQTYKADTDMDALEGLNPDASPTKLQVGQLLWVPCPCTYTVASRDTAAAILAKLGVAEDKVKTFNPSANLQQLTVGQVLVVPCPSSAGATSAGRKLLL